MAWRAETGPETRSGGMLLLDALRHRWVTFVAVAVGVTVAVLLMVATTPSRYDATAVVGLAPGPDGSTNADVVKLAASQTVEAATSQRVLAAAESSAGVPAGTLTTGNVLAELVPETAMVQLVVSDGDPQVAARLANSVATATAASADSARVQAVVVRGAQVPAGSAAPARGLYSVAGLFAGTGLALLVVIGTEVWRPRVRSASHLASVLGVPTVADLRDHDFHGTPQEAMRLAQLRLSRPDSAASEASRASQAREAGAVATVAGVAVLGTGQIPPSTLDWVTEGIATALTVAGHRATLIDPNGPSRSRSVPEGPAASTGVVCVRAVVHADRSAQALAHAHALRRAIVVVGDNAPVAAIHRLRCDLETAGVALDGGVLVRGAAAPGAGTTRRSRAH